MKRLESCVAAWWSDTSLFSLSLFSCSAVSCSEDAVVVEQLMSFNVGGRNMLFLEFLFLYSKHLVHCCYCFSGYFLNWWSKLSPVSSLQWTHLYSFYTLRLCHIKRFLGWKPDRCWVFEVQLKVNREMWCYWLFCCSVPAGHRRGNPPSSPLHSGRRCRFWPRPSCPSSPPPLLLRRWAQGRQRESPPPTAGSASGSAGGSLPVLEDSTGTLQVRTDCEASSYWSDTPHAQLVCVN